MTAKTIFPPLKFLVIGLINTIFGYSLYSTLIYIEFPIEISLLSSTLIGVIFNFVSFSKLLFKENLFAFLFLKFVICYILIYFLNIELLKFLINIRNLNPFLSQALCLPIFVIISWLLLRFFVYKRKT
jgi:putative flippase GtrA